MSPADVLEAAADALFVHGRFRGRAVNDDGAMCVESALCFVQGHHPFNWGTEAARKAPALCALAAYLGCEPWTWNDNQRGPEGDAVVIDTLKKCAKALREVES